MISHVKFADLNWSNIGLYGFELIQINLKLRRCLKVFSSSIFILKLSITMKSVVNEKASIIEKSSSPLCRLLRSRVLRRTRGSVTLRKILTPKSHRQRYKKTFCFCVMASSSSLWWLRCGVTQIHTHTNTRKSKETAVHMIFTYYHLLLLARYRSFSRRRNPTTKHTFFFPYYSFFFFTNTPPHTLM